MTQRTTLSPRLRLAIAEQLRWKQLRPLQEACIAPVLQGEHVVLVAPTAGGKTEAALLPALDVLAAEPTRPGVRLLYLSPLVALLNDQAFRLERLGGLVGLDAFTWHGGVSAAEKRAFRKDPAGILLTTPESLEGFLRRGEQHLFRSVRFVVIDELHAFAGSVRGAHLSSVLDRLLLDAEFDAQRIGLSATVASPALLGSWLKGRSPRPGRVIRASHQRKQRTAEIREMPDISTAVREIVKVSEGKKTLAFVESRAGAEELSRSVGAAGRQLSLVYHAGLDRETRTRIEQQLRAEACVTVCATSAMELGLDIGDLDEVVQWRPAPSVSSLLQRWGRSGRRGGVSRLTTYTFTPQETLHAAAQLSLAEEGWVEDIHLQRRNLPLLVQQMLCEVLARPHTSVSLWKSLHMATPFSEVLEEEYREILNHLIRQDILASTGGHLVIGDAGERTFGKSGFRSLLSAFDAPEEYLVVEQRGQAEVGYVSGILAGQLEKEVQAGRAATFLLSGRNWLCLQVDHLAGRVTVQATPQQGPSISGTGTNRAVAYDVARRQLELLCGLQRPAGLNAQAQASIDQLSEEASHLSTEHLTVTVGDGRLLLQTYAGDRINRVLGALLTVYGDTDFDSYQVSLRTVSADRQQQAIDWLQGQWQEETSETVTQGLEKLTLTASGRFLSLLPEKLRQRYLLEDYDEWERLRSFLTRYPLQLSVLE